MKAIKASEIVGLPKSAEYVLLSPENSIQMFYRIRSIKYNDGTYKDEIEYRSSFGVWTRSTLDSIELLTKIIK